MTSPQMNRAARLAGYAATAADAALVALSFASIVAAPASSDGCRG